jgi:hypothetical protein
MNFLPYVFTTILLFTSNPQIALEQVKLPQVERTIESSTLSTLEKIKAEFGENSKMLGVVKCESNFRQFKNGEPLMSPTSDVGVMQINQVHWKKAKELGLDIFNSVDDNIKMGRRIYDSQGIKAWTCYDIVYNDS